MNIQYQLVREGAQVPSFFHDGDAGADLFACLEEQMEIPPWSHALVPTGVAISLPDNMMAEVRSRSGMALKYGCYVLNQPGTIDPGFRGEVGVILATRDRGAMVGHGHRIAQLVFSQFYQPTFVPVDEFGESERGENGYGSTGDS